MLSTYSQPLIIVTFCQNICLKESKKDGIKVTPIIKYECEWNLKINWLLTDDSCLSAERNQKWNWENSGSAAAFTNKSKKSFYSQYIHGCFFFPTDAKK